VTGSRPLYYGGGLGGRNGNWVDGVIEQVGGLDAVVSNAGIFRHPICAWYEIAYLPARITVGTDS
jgi:hypothetical protein